MVTSQDFIQYQRLQTLHWTVLPTWHTKGKKEKGENGLNNFQFYRLTGCTWFLSQIKPFCMDRLNVLTINDGECYWKIRCYTVVSRKPYLRHFRCCCFFLFYISLLLWFQKEEKLYYPVPPSLSQPLESLVALTR